MVQTRYGRTIKKPERFSPQEKVLDDYSTDEHDTDWDSDVSSEISYDPEDVEEESDSDDHDFIDDDEEIKKEPSEEDNGCDDDTSSETSEPDASSITGGTGDGA